MSITLKACRLRAFWAHYGQGLGRVSLHIEDQRRRPMPLHRRRVAMAVRVAGMAGITPAAEAGGSDPVDLVLAEAGGEDD